MDLLQFIAGMLVLAGIYLYGHKWKEGPLVSCAGCLCWLIVSLHFRMPWMALLNVILASMHFINLMKWRHEQ